jgi:hypothetical protein
VALYLPLEEVFLGLLPVFLYTPLKMAMELLLFGLLLLVVADRFARGHFPARTPLDVPIILYAVAVVLSGLWNSIAPFETFVSIWAYLRFAVVFYLVCNLGVTPEFRSSVVRVILIGMSIQVAVGLSQIFVPSLVNPFLQPHETAEFMGFERISIVRAGYREWGSIWGTTGDTIRLAQFLLIGVSAALATLLHTTPSRRGRWLLVVLITCGFVCLFYTYSRAVIFSTFLGVLVIVVLAHKERWRSRLLAVVIPMILAIAVVVLVGSPREHPETPVGHLTRSFTARYVDYVMASQRGYILFEVPPPVMRESPWFGFGPSKVSMTAHLRLVERGLDPEAVRLLGDVRWVERLAHLGLIGFLTSLWIYAWMLLHSFRTALDPSPRRGETIVALVLGGMLTGLLFDEWFSVALEVRLPSYLLWLLAGTLFATEVEPAGERLPEAAARS